MEAGKKSSLKGGTRGKAAARATRWFGLLSVIIAMAIIAAVPVALNPGAVYSGDPTKVYLPIKLGVLMWLSAALLAVLGIAVLDRRPLRVPVLIPALVFLAVSALSTLLAEDPMHSLYGDRNDGLLSLAGGVLLFYAAARGLDSAFRVRIFLAAAVATAVLVSIFGISQKYGFDPFTGWLLEWYTYFGRPFSSIGNPVTLAAYLTLMIGAATALWFRAGSRAGRVPWLLALAVMGAGWIYTDTRGAILGVGVALPVVLWVARRKMGTTRPLLIPLATLLGAMALALAASAAFGNLTLSASNLAVLAAYPVLVGAVMGLSHYMPRAARAVLIALGALVVAAMVAAVASGALGNALFPGRAADGGGMNSGGGISGGMDSVEIRLYAWRDTIPMILERPLLGHGPDNFREPFGSHVSEELRAVSTPPGGTFQPLDKAHNDVLQVAATTGLLGLAAYLWILVAYFRGAYRRGGWPLIALSGGVLAYVLQLQTAFPTLDTNVAFWGVLGASVAVMRLHDRQSGDLETPEAGGVQTALTATTPRAKAYELAVVAVVVGVVAAIAIPTSLEQREMAAKIQRGALGADVRRTVLAYQLAESKGKPYPEAGVYTSSDLIKAPGFKFRPSAFVTINTTTSPNGFKVEGESIRLSGAFKLSYDSSTDRYTPTPARARGGGRGSS
jgi:O-antigen ligase